MFILVLLWFSSLIYAFHFIIIHFWAHVFVFCCAYLIVHAHCFCARVWGAGSPPHVGTGEVIVGVLLFLATPLPPVLCRGFFVAAASTVRFHCSYCAFSSSFLNDSFRGGTTTGAAAGGAGGAGAFPPPPPPADWLSLPAPPTMDDVRFKLRMARACNAAAGAGGRIVVEGLGRARFCAEPPSAAACEEEEEEDEVADPSLGAKEEERCNCRAAESWL